MKTEKEKMLNGELYIAVDPISVTHEDKQVYNQTRETEDEKRTELLKERFGSILGESLYIEPTFCL
jgi:maltose O-acetyltransferase